MDYFIPNEAEAETVTGMPVRTMAQGRACARRLLDEGFSRVLITLGARGVLVASSEDMIRIPSFPLTAKDTTGAGDAFVGSFAVFLAEGCPEREAVARANLYAALSTTRPGAQSSYLRRAGFERHWRARRGTQVPGPPR